jgi:hypothetical protein
MVVAFDIAGSFQLVITLLLGAGGATFVWTVTRSYLAIKNRADSREDTALSRMEQHEIKARDELEQERAWGAYWFRRAAILERALIRNGIEAPYTGPEPVPTSFTAPNPSSTQAPN